MRAQDKEFTGKKDWRSGIVFGICCGQVGSAFHLFTVFTRDPVSDEGPAQWEKGKSCWSSESSRRKSWCCNGQRHMIMCVNVELGVGEVSCRPVMRGNSFLMSKTHRC